MSTAIERRANRIHFAIAEVYGNDRLEHDVVDAMIDLQHLCDRRKLDYQKLAEVAKRRYLERRT